MSWFGLGKKRSAFGKWMDKKGLQQIDLENESGLSRGTISKLCNDDNYTPKHSTIAQVIRALKSMGQNINKNDFWDM